MKLDKVKKKAIEHLSKRLPISYEHRKVGIAVNSMEYDLDTRRKYNLKDNEFYKAFRNKFIEINHISRMERAYKKYGEQGIIDYIYWLNNNNKSLKEKYEKLKLDSVSQDVLDIAKQGAKGFWKNLLDFLFAFLKVFGNKSN